MKTTNSILLAALTGLVQAQSPIANPGIGDFYPNLQRALQLTGEQWARVAGEGNALQGYLFEKSQRLAQIGRELTIEQLRPAPDPMALGVRYVEIASICHESTDRVAALRQSLRGVLNAEQRTRLAQLEAGMALLPPIAEGQDTRFLGTEVKNALVPGPALPSASFLQGWRASRGPGDFVPGCPVTGAEILGALIQGSFNLADRYPNLVRQLGLDGAQIDRILELNSRFQQSLGERQTEAWQIRTEMDAESERPVPNAAVLGAKAVRLEQICRESLASETALRVAVPALLSETQRARWQELERALQLLPALAEAQELNMNGRAPANALPPPFAAGLPPQRRYEWTTIFSGSQVLPGCDGGATTGGRWFGATPQIAPAVRSAEDAFAEGRMDGLKPVAR